MLLRAKPALRSRAFTEQAVFCLSEPDLALVIKQPSVSIDHNSHASSPDRISAQQHPHTRANGTFSRVLRKYLWEENQLTLLDATARFFALPAQRMRLIDPGVLKQGLWADVVIFDPANLRDKATFENPNQFSEGIRSVLVNGLPIIAGGNTIGGLPGKVLRGLGLEPQCEPSLVP